VLLTVALSTVGLGACSDDADDAERAELRPVAESRAPATPVLDPTPAVPRDVGEKRRSKKPRRKRSDAGGIQKDAAASGGGAGSSAPSSPAPVADSPAPAPPAAGPEPPRQPAATPSKPPAGGGDAGGQTRAKPAEVECAPRCP
jgi:hypothetical protein